MCHILHNEQKIKRHVEGVKGVKHCTLIPIKDQKAMHVGGVEKYIQGPQYRVMLLKSKVSKVAQYIL